MLFTRFMAGFLVIRGELTDQFLESLDVLPAIGGLRLPGRQTFESPLAGAGIREVGDVAGQLGGPSRNWRRAEQSGHPVVE
jgi:hypothetical protein